MCTRQLRLVEYDSYFYECVGFFHANVDVCIMSFVMSTENNESTKQLDCICVTLIHNPFFI